MKVERAQFLMLTALIAGATTTATAACSSSTKGTADGNGDASTGGKDSSASTDNDASTCDDTDAGTTTCASLTSSCAESLTFEPHCEAFFKNLKGGVAARAATCLAHAPMCEGILLDGGLVGRAEEAIQHACSDPTAEGFCAPLVEGCAAEALGGNLPMADCVAFANALTAKGREEFVSCVTEGTPGHCAAEAGKCLRAYP